MTAPTLYPPADHTTQWYGQGNSVMAMRHVKWLLHTTESAGGWPGYTGGADAPNLTYEPWQHRWRQHFPINGSARALENDGLFQTNRADVVQVEISCYCDPYWYSRNGHSVLDLDDQALDDLAAFAAWMHTEWGMDLQLVDLPWPPYPESLNDTRMGDTAYENFSGMLGHEHAPGNHHGDPGALAVHTILDRAKTIVEGDDMTKKELLEVLNSPAGQAAIGKAVLNADLVPLPPNAFSEQYRKDNPTFRLKYAIQHVWQAAINAAHPDN